MLPAEPLLWTRIRPGLYSCAAHRYLIRRLDLHRPLWRLFLDTSPPRELFLGQSLTDCKAYAQRRRNAQAE